MTNCSRYLSVTVATAILAISICSFAQILPTRRTSQYYGEALSRLQARCAGVNVTIEPLQPSYIEGEDVLVHVRISCHPARPRPWYPPEYISWIVLLRDGQRVGHIRSDLDMSGMDRDSSSVFDDTISIGDFYDRSASEISGFNYLSAGQYTGYFDLGLVSPDFQFEVTPIPDSLTGAWEQYSQLRKLEQVHVMNLDRAATALLQESAVHFLNRPVGSALRKEALHSALQTYAHAHNRWTPEDSLACIHVLTGLATEPKAHVSTICAAAFNTIFRGTDDLRAAEVLLELADRVQRADIRAAAENVAANPLR